MKFYLIKIWNAWKTFAKALGRINTKIILSIFFFLIFGPIVLIRKFFYLFKRKPSQKKSYWIKKEAQEQKIENYYRPF